MNLDAGAKTPLAAVIGALLLMTLVLLVAPLAAWLPNAAMAGVLFLVAWSLIDFHHIRQILRASRSQSLILVTTFAAALLLNLEESPSCSACCCRSPSTCAAPRGRRWWRASGSGLGPAQVHQRNGR